MKNSPRRMVCRAFSPRHSHFRMARSCDVLHGGRQPCVVPQSITTLTTLKPRPRPRHAAHVGCCCGVAQSRSHHALAQAADHRQTRRPHLPHPQTCPRQRLTVSALHYDARCASGSSAVPSLTVSLATHRRSKAGPEPTCDTRHRPWHRGDVTAQSPAAPASTSTTRPPDRAHRTRAGRALIAGAVLLGLCNP